MGALRQPMPHPVTCELTGEEEKLPIAEVKAHLLRLVDEVVRERKALTITRRGAVVGHIIPPQMKTEQSAFEQVYGRSKGKMRILGDIVSPDWESWGPEWR